MFYVEILPASRLDVENVSASAKERNFRRLCVNIQAFGKGPPIYQPEAPIEPVSSQKRLARGRSKQKYAVTRRWFHP